NVAADSAALCLKSGNAVILRGGKEAINSTCAICEALSSALVEAGLPADCVQLVRDTSRESARELMRLNEFVDLLVPRGGAGLIRSVIENSTVPVIETGAGVCHIYVDKDADLEMAAQILYNAKTSRPSVCNACECALVHNDIAEAFLPRAKELLDKKSVEIRADAAALANLPEATPAAAGDWGKEYGDLILAVKTVSSMEEALEHIASCGTGHSEAIVTNNAVAAEEFLNRVDAAAVYHNASTRFTDGGEFGLGAEIGISTQKLHARGPLGVRELVSYKYKLRGEGQVR
ncbi:MAG: glutamate-5-semialdehyde dehydrogenase, partial [Oscillospiraceae bacterium]|nr:glutamate-5-semialdehyde dehydrogenase [Oscillospiraceae bacterium]